jgi:hypothetical protein
VKYKENDMNEHNLKSLHFRTINCLKVVYNYKTEISSNERIRHKG